MLTRIDVSSFVRSPDDIVSIQWEVDGASGSTQCKAWEAQYEIDQMSAAGYRITDVVPA